MSGTNSQSLLGDLDGEWCAICLDYARRGDPLTPVMPADMGEKRNKQALEQLQAWARDFPFGGVRAHRGCLAAVPAFGLVPQAISNYIRLAHRMSPDQIDRAAKTFHDQGFYSLSASLKDVLLRKSDQQGPAHKAQILEHKIASLAGVHDAKRVAPLSDQELRKHRDRLGIFLHQANWYANVGQRSKADELLRHVEDLRGGQGTRGHTIESSYRMRVAQIRRSGDAARRAIAGATADPYMTNTAYVLAGHIFVPDDPSRARTYFDSILAQGHTPSWLYRAESLFGIASLMLRSRETPHEAYKYLATAQYIYGTLGLQGTPHPNLHERLRSDDLTPRAVLRHDVQMSGLPKGERFGLRREAIINSGVQAEILSSVLLLVPAQQRRPVDTAQFHRRSRVLVLGPDTPRHMKLLRQIVKCLAELAYTGIIVKDELEFPEETNEQKVQRLVATSRFVIMEHSRPAGQIDELRMIAPDRYVVAILHREGTQATWMQSDYDIGFEFVKFFPYEMRSLASVIDRSCSWAEQCLTRKAQRLRGLYPWRKSGNDG